MKTIIYEGVVTALSSIVHMGELNGNRALFRRESVVLPNGREALVPVVSGNALRGVLRDRGMAHMCRAIGIGEGETRLSLPAFYFLFSGGSLNKGGGGSTVDMARVREMRRLMPLVSVFGGADGDRILPGRIKVHKLLPIASETAHLLPAFLRDHPHTHTSVWDRLGEEQYVRHDDAKDDRKHCMIEEKTLKLLHDSAMAAVEKRNAGDALDRTQGKQQMIYQTEVLRAGTQFHFRFVLDDVNDLEHEAFMTALAAFSAAPYVGGKSSIGHGEVSLRAERYMLIDSRLQTEGTELAAPLGTTYQQHICENAEGIRSWLDTLK